MMAEKTNIILGFVYEKHTQKMSSKIGLRYVLSWFNVGMEPKFHEAMTFGE